MVIEHLFTIFRLIFVNACMVKYIGIENLGKLGSVNYQQTPN